MKASHLFAVRCMTFGFVFEHVMLFYYLKISRGVTIEVLVFLPLCRSLTAVFSIFDAFQYNT